jgi:hypothetical protein
MNNTASVLDADSTYVKRERGSVLDAAFYTR